MFFFYEDSQNYLILRAYFLIMRLFFFTLLAVFYAGSGYSQSVNAPLNDDYYHLIDRYEILQGQINPFFFSGWKPYMRKDIALFADSLKRSEAFSDRVDQFNINYLLNDNWEFAEEDESDSRTPFLSQLYRKKSDFYHVSTPSFDLHVNPVLSLAAGTSSDADYTPFTNTRGVEIRGMIDGKVGFYTFLGENQVFYPGYVRDYINRNLTVPGEAFWKGFKDDGVDFFTARGYISFQATQHINVQFGHDRFRMGHGYRSMILSDYAPASLFLKVDAQIWKLKYTFMVKELTAQIQGNPDGLTGSTGYPNKFLAFHQVQVNIGKKLTLGFFESVIYSNTDPTMDTKFEWKYLNPIIFYRAIEQQDGSTDNVILGMDTRWLVTRGVALYGQFTIDELVFDELSSGEGWWGNKFGVQLGGEWVNAFGVPHLDVQLETNIARPYAYSHDTPSGSYSHYRQPLAHPLGANFKEVVGIMRYQPTGKLMLTGKLMYAQYGRDTLSSNWGGNILLQNTSRERDYGNTIGQGVDTKQVYASFMASFQFRHNLFFDLGHVLRKSESAYDPYDITTNFTSAGVRWNIPARVSEF
jgi:hypothetical protein